MEGDTSPCRRSSSSSPGRRSGDREDRGDFSSRASAEDHRPPLRHGRSPAAAFGPALPGSAPASAGSADGGGGRQMGNGAAQRPSRLRLRWSSGLGLPPSMPPGMGCRHRPRRTARPLSSASPTRLSDGVGVSPTRAHAQPDPMPLTARIPATPRHAPLPEPALRPPELENAALVIAGPSARDQEPWPWVTRSPSGCGAPRSSRCPRRQWSSPSRGGKRHRARREPAARSTSIPGSESVELDESGTSSRCGEAGKARSASSTATRTPA